MTHQLTKEELRGCPFCGGLGELEEIESGCYGVGCQSCDFQLMNGSIGIGWHKSESDAVRVWNERNSDLCIQGLQDWTKKLQSSLDAASKRIAELEQGKCLHQIAEPATAGTAVRAFRDYLGVHDGIKLGGQAMDDMALDLARIALDFKHLVEPQHPDDAAVDALAVLMKAKLAKQREKGYGGWDTDCTQQRLSDMLRAHVEKGDPVDVANFCAFLLARGEGIAAAPQAVQPAVPAGGQSRFKGEKDWQWCSPEHVAMVLATPSEWQGYEVRYLYAAPAHPAEGVANEDEAFEKWWSTPHVWGLGHKAAQRSAFAAGVAHAAATQPAAQGLDAKESDYQRGYRHGYNRRDAEVKGALL